MSQDQHQRRARLFEGKVISDTMAKTIVVQVERLKTHPKYQKKFKVSRTFHVHDPKGLAKAGNRVLFQECRPLSKTKKWRLIRIIT